MRECDQCQTLPFSAAQAVLKGDMLVRISRVAAGRNLGPGCYDRSDSLGTPSHNIRTISEFKRLQRLKAGKEESVETSPKTSSEKTAATSPRKMHSLVSYRPGRFVTPASRDQDRTVTTTTANESSQRIMERMCRLAQNISGKRRASRGSGKNPSSRAKQCSISSLQPLSVPGQEK